MPRTSLLTVVACFLSIGAAAADPPTPGEVKLGRALEDRVAGKPTNCIALRRIRGSRIIDRTAIIYEAGGTLYINRPSSGAETLSASNVLVTKTPTGEVCRGEIVQLFDTGAHFQVGTVILGPFVPYRKSPPAYSPPQRGGYSKSGY